MRSSLAFLAAFGLLGTVSATAGTRTLVPITATSAANLQARDEAPQVALQNQQSVLWGQNPNGASK
jgi:hypothetical protein